MVSPNNAFLAQKTFVSSDTRTSHKICVRNNVHKCSVQIQTSKRGPLPHDNCDWGKQDLLPWRLWHTNRIPRYRQACHQQSPLTTQCEFCMLRCKKSTPKHRWTGQNIPELKWTTSRQSSWRNTTWNRTYVTVGCISRLCTAATVSRNPTSS